MKKTSDLRDNYHRKDGKLAKGEQELLYHPPVAERTQNMVKEMVYQLRERDKRVTDDKSGIWVCHQDSLVLGWCRCPACRNYKSQCETVAKLFNGPEAGHPGIIFIAWVDCALTDRQIRSFVIGFQFSTILCFYPPSKFAAGGWEPKEDKKSEIFYIDDGRTSERLLNWINKQMGSSFSLEDDKYENEDMLRVNASDPGQFARAVYDVAEATANAFSIIVETKMIKYETQASLIMFLQLLVAHHPSKRCRRGSAETLVNFDEFWPSNLLSATQQEASLPSENNMLQTFRICGKDVPHGYWIFCRGSKNVTRGFSCGLWVLLHSLSVRIEDGESHLTFTSICEFVRNFFICEECRQHFYKMC